MTKKWWTFFVTLMLLCSLSASACAANENYVESIAVYTDGLGANSAKSEVRYRLGSGFLSRWDVTIIDKDLNDGAGGDFIYMGYGCYEYPLVSNPITGILFYETDSEESPDDSIFYDNIRFNILGDCPKERNGIYNNYTEIIDLNKDAGGKYIYTYITRNPAYGPALVEIGVGSKNDPYVIRNTDGKPQNLNAGCTKFGESASEIYLYAKPYDAAVHAIYYYLDANGITQRGTISKQLLHHKDTLSELPNVPATVTYAFDYTMTFQGWATAYDGISAEPVEVGLSDETTEQFPKIFYAVYACTPKLTYNANGGSSAPAAQSMTIFNLNASYYQPAQQKNFTITSTLPTHENPCYEFLGWATDPNATQPEYAAGQSVAFNKNTTLYAVWQPHHYGALIPAQPGTHTKDTLKPGTSAYYQCTKCMGYFTESKQPTTIFDLLGETPVHTFEDSVCTECGYVMLLTGTRSYVVTYDANGGTGSMLPQLFSTGVAQKLTANTFTRPGYTFIGWNTAADGSGTSYRADTNFTATRSLKLYAQWQAIDGWTAPSTDDLPKTGDPSTPVLWMATGLLSALGMLLLRKKVYSRS